MIISHRGNISEKIPNKENHPDYLLLAINFGYDIELDVWFIDNKFVLGHDIPQYIINDTFLMSNKMWIHAKNLKALHKLKELNVNCCFFHNTDDAVFTSNGWIWTYPGKQIISKYAIAVLPETIYGWDISLASGVCTDFPIRYRTSI